jgi:hypothetical protein
VLGSDRATHNGNNAFATLFHAERIRNVQSPGLVLQQQERLMWSFGRLAFLRRESDFQGVRGAQGDRCIELRRGCESVMASVNVSSHRQKSVNALLFQPTFLRASCTFT